MDPNEALWALREAVKVILKAQDVSGDVDVSGVALEMAESFDGLDGWIMRGGFLPTDWAKAQHKSEG